MPNLAYERAVIKTITTKKVVASNQSDEERWTFVVVEYSVSPNNTFWIIKRSGALSENRKPNVKYNSLMY